MAAQWYDLHLHVKKRVVRPFLTDVEGEDLCGFTSYDLRIGKRIRGWNLNASLRSISRKDDGVPDDVLKVHLHVPTFSQRLCDALKKAGVAVADIQYLPVHVYKSTGEELEGYAFANVITRVAALNYDSTDWGDLPPDEEEGIDPNTGKPEVQAIWRAALIGRKLKGHDMIRLLEFWPPVYVSERFADVYRAGNFTGATLTPVVVT
jgi:hypothetical protein